MVHNRFDRTCRTLPTRSITRISIEAIAFVSATLLFSVPAYAVAIFDVSINSALYGNLPQTLVTGCGGDPTVACGPTAATNSLVYLQRQFPIYDKRLIPDLNNNGMIDQSEMLAVANTLGAPDFMDCSICQGGTRHDNFIFGKQKYIDQQAPGSTVYAAQDPFPWNNPARPRPGYVQPVGPTFDFLFGELKRGEDVEILINGSSDHYLTLNSLHWVDANMDGVIQRSEGATMDFIDPANGAPGMADIFMDGAFIGTDYGGGLSDITVAVSESPVPEPSTLLLPATGFISLLGYGWRRKSTPYFDPFWNV